MELWTVATGNVVPWNKKSREALNFIKNLEGFVGAQPHYPYGTLWFFDSENNAKIARNLMQAKGILCGKNICKVEADV